VVDDAAVVVGVSRAAAFVQEKVERCEVRDSSTAYVPHVALETENHGRQLALRDRPNPMVVCRGAKREEVGVEHAKHGRELFVEPFVPELGALARHDASNFHNAPRFKERRQIAWHHVAARESGAYGLDDVRNRGRNLVGHPMETQ
jgi:hypothetical protein